MSRGDSRKSTPLLAVDTGGTFTDLVLLRDGELTALKVPSDPLDPAGPVLRGIARILGSGSSAGLAIVHGSTVATNTILERKGTRVFLITNAGFEDVIEIGRQDRPQLYALVGHRPPPLVARSDRLGIRGRTGPDGADLDPLDPAELQSLAGRVREAGAVAVVLLHSYAAPEHEETVAEALAGTSVPLSISSRLLPEFREFERTSTTVANAYVAPAVSRYLGGLAAGLEVSQVRVMGSSGSAISLERAIEEPVQAVLSGPAGGVVGALEWGRRSGLADLLSLDMGGTSTDVALVSRELRYTREGRVGDVPVAVPLLDIHTVGAGGGSIARVDPGGALRVGPESAGAVPGPVAYGKGGGDVTVTDAHVWLGRLPETAVLGGELCLDREAIRGPLEALAGRAGTSPDRAAEGILNIANAAMERALRVMSVERGIDPADLHLVAFGGAAGLHAAELAERLGLAGALIPPDPGLLSAFGMLVAPVVRNRSRTVFLSSDDPEHPDRMSSVFDELEFVAREEMVSEGVENGSVTITRSIDARYRDQSFELVVPVDRWVERFHRAHEERFGYRRGGVPVDAVTLRLRAEAPGASLPAGLAARSLDSDPGGAPAPGKDRSPMSSRVTWRGRTLDARVLYREELAPGPPIDGPAVVVEYSATTWCPPAWRIEREESGALRLTRAES